MLLTRQVHPSSLAVRLIAAACLVVPSVALASDAASAGTASVSGTVFEADGKGAAGAEVLLSPLGAAEVAYRAVTERDGDFSIEGVQHGYYDLTVVVGESAYLSNRVLLLPPEKNVDVEFDLGEFLPVDRQSGLDEARSAPGTNLPVAGVARLRERLGPTGWAWFKTGRGVAVLIGGGTAIIGGIIALADDDDDPVSPVSPVSP